MAVNFRTEQITENHQVILKLVELLPKVGGILIIVFRFTGDLKNINRIQSHQLVIVDLSKYR